MNLNLIPVNERPQAVVSVLRQSGAVIANDLIQGLADKHGDGVAKALVAKLPAHAVAEIVKSFDYTKTSIVGDLLTPVLLRDAVCRLPLQRSETDSDVCDVLCAVIIPRNEEGTSGAFFRELGKSTLGVLALATAFPHEEMVAYHACGCFSEDDDAEEVDERSVKVGSWEELAFLLKTTSPSVFYKVMEVIQTSLANMPPTDLNVEFERLARETFKMDTVDTDDPYAVA